MHILIAYATTEGQTAKVAQYAADYLKAEGHDVSLVHLEAGTVLDPGLFDAAILAGSVHVGQLQPELSAFATAHSVLLNRSKSMLLQVSLAAAGHDAEERVDLDRIARAFCDATGWQPTTVVQVAGALNMPEYNFVVAWMMRRIAKAHDAEFDPDGVTEFTDWEALRKALETWLTAV